MEVFIGRVFDANDRADDSVDGLIMLCEEWVQPCYVMAEIGCYRGVSTSIFAQYAKTVHAVDPWSSNPNYKELPTDMMMSAEPLFDKMCKAHTNVIKHKGFSIDVSKTFQDESLDAVYIDGAHDEENVRIDFNSWIPKVKQGGIVSGHDYCLVGTLIPATKVTVYPDNSWVYVKGSDDDLKRTVR